MLRIYLFVVFLFSSISSLSFADNNIQEAIVTFDSGKKTAEMVFPWSTRVASAVFIRNNILWVVFNKDAKINLKKLQQQFGSDLLFAEQIKNKSNTILRLNIKNLVSVKTDLLSNNNWKITCSFSSDIKFIPENAITQYNSPFAKGIFFPVENYSYPVIEIMDPVFGDDISIIPIFDAKVGVEKGRSFVDFKLLPTAQGFVTKILSDDAYIKTIKSGIEFIISEKNFIKSDKTGFIFTPKKNSFLDEKKNVNDNEVTVDLSNKKSKEDTTRKSILYLPKANDANYLKMRSILDYQNMLSLGNDAINSALKLATFYFVHEQYYECDSVIQLIQNEQDAKEIKDTLILLQVISRYMTNRNEEAKKSLDMISKNSSMLEEVQYWANIINIANGLNAKNFLENEKIPASLFSYPPKIRIKTFITQLKYNIENNIPPEQTKWLIDYINSNNTDQYTQNTIMYYQSILQNQSGNQYEALRNLKSIITQDDDAKNKIRSSILYYQIMMEKQNLTPEQVLFELNKLRLSWRWSEVEGELLVKIGELYMQISNYSEAIIAFKGAYTVSNSPDDRLKISSKISQAFVKYFTDESAIKNSNDFNAVSNFYEFKDYMPIGKESDNVVSKIIDRLINLNLLDKAANLLKHQINYRLSGEEKKNAALKLANVYIENNQPHLALETIQQYNKNFLNPSELDSESLETIAKAYMMQNKYDLAYKYLKNDFSDNANNLKIHLFTKQKKWENLRVLLLVLLGNNNSDEQEEITKQQSEYLKKLILCYYMEGDFENIKKLYNKYNKILDKDDESMQLLALLSDGQYVFDLENPNKESSIKNIENLLSIIKEDIKLPLEDHKENNEE